MTNSNKNSRRNAIEYADTPEEIAAMIKAAAREIEARGPPSYPDPMEPPWKVMPDEPMGSMAWRMGSGEDYRYDFSDWFYQLSQTEKQKYESENPEPEDWIGYYDQLRLRKRSL